jgi:hypothetical protein
MAVVANDLQSLDRLLQAFGYDGNLEDLPVVESKMVLFHKSELQQHLLFELRRATEPLSSRDLAVRLATSEGRDRFDKRLVYNEALPLLCAVSAPKVQSAASTTVALPRERPSPPSWHNAKDGALATVC